MRNENSYNFSVGNCYKIKGIIYDTYLGKYKESRRIGIKNGVNKYIFINNSGIESELSSNKLDKIEEIPCKPQDNSVTTGGYIKKNKSKKNKSKKNKSKKSSKKIKSKKQKSKKYSKKQ
jgi:hypothetical protein